VALAACERFERNPGVGSMTVVWLIAGIGCLLAGLLAIGFGIPVKEFSFGNTLILTGTVAACTGMIMLGLWMAVRELKEIVRRLGPGVASEARAGTTAATLQRAPENADDAEAAAQPSGSAPWHDEAATRDRERNDAPPVPEPVEAAPAVKPRRNLLFSSSSRKERDRAQARTEPSIVDLGPEPALAPPVAEPGEPPPATFDDAWPKSERSRPLDTSPRRSGRAPSTFTEANAGAVAADRYPPPAPNEAQPPVTVLKSGVVDGMAYSLYSDGSIEAQMPEGMMRFASIDELRAHLDHRP
jgi:hypothetical protein